MLDDELRKPLGSGRRPNRLAGRPIAIAAPLVVAALLLAMAGVWVQVIDDRSGPVAAVIALATDGDDGPDATAAIPLAPAAEAKTRGPLDAARLPDRMRMTAAPVAALVEMSPSGPLPRIATTGERPMDVYARPPRPAGEAPRIAIIVGGLGLSQTGTFEALKALPPDVTLAFQPNGSSLKRWAERARQEGHEILAQALLEPDGYPAADPGPHTLVTSRPWDMNRAELDWSLGRVAAYTGVLPFAGGRFETDDESLRPFLRALAGRGLFVIDPGRPGSRLAEIGAEVGAAVLKADAVIDADRSPEAIRAALAQLEDAARASGLAVGVASAFPETVQAIAEWSNGAAARGVVLVPARSALGG